MIHRDRLAGRHQTVPARSGGRIGFLCETEDEMVAAVGRVDEPSPAACRARVREQFSGPARADGYERVFARVVPPRMHLR
ncbi:MAG TPA: hypothetical protein VHO00_06705 [Actinomycetes bacterium]|jgi:hypothetical protein|nr:hypothetical protein [Actinomycetes bacterium]